MNDHLYWPQSVTLGQHFEHEQCDIKSVFDDTHGFSSHYKISVLEFSFKAVSMTAALNTMVFILAERTELNSVPGLL